jgi:uridylate kinase
MKNIVVISLGGSLIVPEKMNPEFLINFVKTLKKHYKTHKFVIVCGGGAIARKYISALRAEKKSNKELALAGIRATRMNARFVMQLFGKEANDSLPNSMKEVKNNLSKNSFVVCGALRYEKNSTSDSTAAQLANYLNTNLINMTNVAGLFTSNPLTDKKAKLISKISWKNFHAIASKIKYSPGQHFVLDQKSSSMILKHKIKTFIIGGDLKNLSRVIEGKQFTGTTISDNFINQKNQI